MICFTLCLYKIFQGIEKHKNIPLHCNIERTTPFSYVYTTNAFQKHNVKYIYKGAVHRQSFFDITSSPTVKENYTRSIIIQNHLKFQHNSTHKTICFSFPYCLHIYMSV